jgi:L-asparaginase II
MTTDEPTLAQVYRGDLLEAEHRGSWCWVDASGVRAGGGDPAARRWPRSALKPLQALPLFASGEPERLGLSAAERAVLVASHSGGRRHVAAVRAVLERAGVPEAALGCGVVAPLGEREARALFASGALPERVHHNCSGKHAGFLLAELYRRLANPEALDPPLAAAARAIFAAVQSEPEYLAGPGRFDTAVLRATGGSVIAKCGAEGCFALGRRAEGGTPGWGFAVKVSDGNARGYETWLARQLADRGWLKGDVAALRPWIAGEVANSLGQRVGRIDTALPD